MCDPLGKNLLLFIWFTENFEGDSSASSLGIFLCMILTGEESSASSLGICFGVLGSIGKESFSSSIGMMLDVLELLRKSLLLHFMRIILDTFGKNLLLPSLEILCLRCLKH